MHTKTVSLLITAVATAALAGFVRAGADPQAGAEPVPPGAVPLLLNQPIELDLKSDAVRWQGGTFHLLRLHEARFSLNDSARLTATLSGSSTSFDDIDYKVHAAVFDKDGRLLGTASAPCKVQRIWLGNILTTQIGLEMDFGRSNAYTDTASVTFAVSSMDVLTPDQWQDD